MTHSLVDVNGRTVEVDCLSCALASGTIEGVGNSVIRTKYFDVSQDFEIPIAGFMIISSLRHLQSVDEFTDEEAQDFVKVLRNTRRLQREVLGVDVVYLHQEEDTSSHFHVWMLPRYDWMNEFGRKVQSMRTIMEYARAEMKTEENIQKINNDLQRLKSGAGQIQV